MAFSPTSLRSSRVQVGPPVADDTTQHWEAVNMHATRTRMRQSRARLARAPRMHMDTPLMRP
eukprot:357811-Chlamydomonas_euryale.AAC.18